MITLNTKEFSFHADTKTFVAEASDLESAHPNLMEHREIELQSEKTGAFKVFRYKSTDKDNEGDITCWVFTSDDGLSIHILND